jgi:hypothetical protein
MSAEEFLESGRFRQTPAFVSRLALSQTGKPRVTAASITVGTISRQADEAGQQDSGAAAQI